MNKTIRLVLSIVFALLLLLGIWYFSTLFTYFVIAFILSLMGQPLMRLFAKIKIRKKVLPAGMRALFTLLIMVGVIVGLVMLVIPVAKQQANTVSHINTGEISTFLTNTFENIDDNLHEYGLLGSEENVDHVLENNLTKLVNMATFKNTARFLLNFTGSFFMGAFSVLFMAFFFLKDANMVSNLILLLTPDRYTDKVRRVMYQTKHLLSRYFVGVLIEISCMITLLIIGLSIFGVPGAVLIGTVGGTFNVIPYLGPIMGASLGSILAMVGEVGMGHYTDFYWVGLKVLLVFGVANLIDNIVLQPLIYSNSVKAHPLEIFVVILMAGSLAGIVGMITAIPVYTMIRIILGEFFSEFKLVRALTQKMSEE